MNPTRSTTRRPLSWLPEFRPQSLFAAIALLAVIPASAAEKAFRYYQFKTTKLVGNGSNVMFSEFDFYHAGTKLNIRNKTGVGAVIPCDATAGDVDPNGGEGSNNLLDGSTATKLFRGSGLLAGNEVVFDFGATLPHPVVDSYSYTSAADSANYIRSPQSWLLSGSEDGVSWTVIDSRIDAVTTLANVTTYGPYEIPEVVAPLIQTFSVRQTPLPGTSAIVLNGQSVTLDWTSLFGTEVKLFTPQENTDGIVVAANGSQVVTPPNDATSTYNLVATKENATDATASATVRTVIGGAKTYQYVRYTGTQRRGGAGSITQISEFEFYNGDATVPANKVVVSSATNPGGDSPAAENVSKLYDGSFTSKWLDFNSRPVIFDFGSAVTFDRYLFVTGNDATDRDAIRWTLEGSNDLARWDLIEDVNFDYPTPLARNASTLSIPLPGASLPARIDFFTGNTATLVAGESLTLSYSTQAAASVEIDPTPGGVLPLYGSVVVTPTVDTTYTLTVNPLNPEGDTVTATFSVVIVEDPGVDDISYDDFAAAGSEIIKSGSTAITAPENALPNRLRLTPEAQGQSGTAWFLKKINGSAGFEATFGLSMNQVTPNNFAPADGLAFVIQNSPSGTGNPGTGESGVSEKALNICFHSFGFAADPASVVEIRSGTEVLDRTVTFTQPGVELYGIPGVPDVNGVVGGGFPYTLGSLSTDPPYRIRVVYVPGDLDVYMDGIAIIQNVDVDLGEIGAADASGGSYFGFTARTGGNVQNSDITDWNVKLGDFSATPAFGMVKTLFRYTAGSTLPTSVDLVWNAKALPTYEVYSSPSLVGWTRLRQEFGINGQIGVNIPIVAPATPPGEPAAPVPSKQFFRVGEIVEP
ncbi:MAG: hypothetical protein V4584_08325 [Verrucomicrobiota bacterium]